ncbi:feruloyl esterase B [Ceratobasidium sp. AG-Ba]|nr:feruloyl esterase B [Ceratobasidium sp. AG-Ba]
MASPDFVQRLKRAGALSQDKRLVRRPLSQEISHPYRRSSQSSTKCEGHASSSSRRSSSSFKAADDWSNIENAIDGMKLESLSCKWGEFISTERAHSSFVTSHHSTPDTDVEMICEEKPPVAYPELPSALTTVTQTLTPQWELPQDFEFVSYSQRHQVKFDSLGLSWGVQWEVARIANLPNVGWDAIRLDRLHELCGSSAEQAPRVLHVLLNDHPKYRELDQLERAVRPSSFTWPWEEYDREEESIRDGSGARLGGDGGYFGGKIDQIVRLTLERDKFKFTILPPAKSKSFRFRRFTGSRRLLEVRFSTQADQHNRIKSMDVFDFFTKKAIVINGRVFRAFYAREKAVHLVETNEEQFRPADPLFGDDHRMSLTDFIQWHNPVYANPNQPLPKWVSRFALGFSDSQPGIPIAPSNIHFIDDIVAPGGKGNSAIMTDGAGFINAAALHRLTAVMKWSSVPVCVQGRFGGSKGLFILHPSDRNRDGEPSIYIRSSQVKVKLHPDPSRWCPSQRIIDVLVRAPMSTGVSITDQIIMNLAHNGVSTSTLSALTEANVRAMDFAPLMQDERLGRLWDTIYTQGGVQELRAKGFTPAALARAQGMADISDEDDRHALSTVKFTYHDDPCSGTPPNEKTQALGLIQAGFRPDFLPLFSRLESIHKMILFGMDDKVHLRIPHSATAFVIPDPLGVLEEGEMFCGFRNPVRDSNGDERATITGPVTRNPCILPSDVRKIMSVESPELWNAGYHDVIVFSVKGKSSQASFLGGGDYDGDTVTMIWDREIVNQFTNSDTHYPEVDVSEFFDLRKGLVKDVAPNQHEPIIKALLAPLTPNQVGMYGMWHATASKVCGLDHPDTVILGNIFTTCLDGQKTGLMPHKSRISRDSARWNNIDPRAPRRLTIIEDLKDILDVHKRDCEIQMNALRPPKRGDPDLLEPYREVVERFRGRPECQAELDRITEFVDKMRHEYHDGEFSVQKRHGAAKFKCKESGNKALSNRKTHSPGQRQEASHAASEAYHQGLPRNLQHIWGIMPQRIAASYAYTKDNYFEPKFSFAVAWNDLCEIKIKAHGTMIGMVPELGNAMSISKKLRQQMDVLYGTED